MRTPSLAVAALIMMFPAVLSAKSFYVAAGGNDRNPGTEGKPFATLAAARDAARAFAGKQAVTVRVGDGIYYLPETLVFTAKDSGTASAPVVYAAVNEGRAILSGGLKLNLTWEPYRDGIFKAQTPAGLAIDQLFLNGKRQRMARYPDFDPAKTTAAYQGFAPDAFSPERAAKWEDPAGGYIHAMHANRWGGYHYRITGKNPDGSVAYEGGWQNNRQMGMHKNFRMVENIFEELDAPGEWFHNAKTNTLYFLPEPGTDLAKASVEVVRLSHLVEFEGTKEAPVKFITLKGFVFRHAARTFMENKEPLLRSDWTIYRGGAVTLTGTEDVRILDSEFDQVGGNGIFVNKYNRRVVIRGCHIHDAGASGVCFVGDPAAVRNPLFEYGQKQDLTAIDRTPGPQTENYPSDSAVEDCLIHGIGRVERQPAGVQISMAARIAVRDTSIYDCGRSGINISEGTWGGHLIERVDVFDTVLETHDHGSFNSWGRDRYWTANHRGVSQPEVQKDPAMPFLDAVETTVIRDSRWRCDHGWDIDLDDGSSNYDIYNNLMLAGGLKLREGYRRHAWNNIHVNNGLHPHVWFDDSDDQFYSNIVMAPHRGVNVPTATARGSFIDKNLFFTGDPAHVGRLREFGWDQNSVYGDPMFVDAAAGDFRVREGSPALALGFKNFPMDQFGVKKPSLKAIAKTPEIPALRVVSRSAATEEQKTYWLGATLHSLAGEEFSAFGVSKDDGGVQLVDVPEGSAAAKAGFLKSDLLQGLNDIKITKASDLFAALAKLGDAPLTASVIRNQQPLKLTIPGAPFVLVESATAAVDLSKLPAPAPGTIVATASRQTVNEPLATLTDGVIAANYGPVFPNGTMDGAYKLDLGAERPVSAISTWSYGQNGRRDRQFVTLFGSASEKDPGWKTDDRTVFTPLGTIETGSVPAATFLATSLRARDGQSLGTYRWIVWRVAPVTSAGENTAFQELSVETVAP